MGIRPFKRLRGSREVISFIAAMIFFPLEEEARGVNDSIVFKPHTEAMTVMIARRREGQVFSLVRRLVRVERWMDLWLRARSARQMQKCIGVSCSPQRNGHWLCVP